MKKGYFFTVDAVIAIILIIIFSAFMVINHPATDNSKVFENYKTQTEDATFVAHYKGVNTPLEIENEFNIYGITPNTPTSNNYYCSYGFEYDMGMGNITFDNFCKGDA
ncbi:MAG: hypothetical protein V1672_02105 [Candidatus Diapherotrites archaeon]